MSTRRATAPDAREEQHVDNEDVTMKDDSDGLEDDADGDANDDGDRDLYQTISDLSTYLCQVEEDGEELAAGFQRIPNRRVLPDYFEVISEPVAFSTIRGKIQKKQYSSFSEFVKDVAQICHNAQVYNRPSAPIFGAAERLREIFQSKLNELVSKGKLPASDAKLPDFGELPPAEDSPPPDSGAEEGDEDEDEEEEDEDDEDEDDDDSADDTGRRRRGRGRRRTSTYGRRDREGDREDDSYKKRGRPPSVLTPTEARISTILRGLRKLKDADGNLLILPFEKLPDKALVNDYYQIITNPIALDNIKKKAKRKKYQNVDHVLTDIDRMFENAKQYNEDGSPLHDAAVELQRQAHVLAEQEKSKPDEDFRDEDGKLPLAEIEYKGEMWKVGDWVHIRNPNDLAKPIVAQIYRTWQDREGQRWINACWYYRPEQTVHRYDKHFFDHEVVKTGQYRDHQIEDVLDRCFVMFVTRFGRGRPRGFPRDKEVYVCESRYNEERFRFNKIKTWASCVPDEVREKDYEMDLFEGPPLRLRKQPSPIKHLLREDAKESDDLPKPTWGSPNAPPIVGAVHRRPREANDSPPPEPTPSIPPVASVDIVNDSHRRPSMVPPTRDIGAEGPPRNMSTPFAGPGPSPSPNQYQAQMGPAFQPPTPNLGGGLTVHQTPVPVPQPSQGTPNASQMQMRPMHYQSHMYSANPGAQYPTSPAPPTHHQPMHQPMNHGYGPGMAPQTSRSASAVGAPGNMQSHGNMYNPPRPPEVYTLPDAVNEAFPPGVLEQFQKDEAGRILFFTAPPLDRVHKGLAPNSSGLGHSAKYLDGRQEWLATRELKRKSRDSQQVNGPPSKLHAKKSDSEVTSTATMHQATEALGKWFEAFESDTARWQKDTGLEGWKESIRG